MGMDRRTADVSRSVRPPGQLKRRWTRVVMGRYTRGSLTVSYCASATTTKGLESSGGKMRSFSSPRAGDEAFVSTAAMRRRGQPQHTEERPCMSSARFSQGGRPRRPTVQAHGCGTTHQRFTSSCLSGNYAVPLFSTITGLRNASCKGLLFHFPSNPNCLGSLRTSPRLLNRRTIPTQLPRRMVSSVSVTPKYYAVTLHTHGKAAIGPIIPRHAYPNIPPEVSAASTACVAPGIYIA